MWEILQGQIALHYPSAHRFELSWLCLALSVFLNCILQRLGSLGSKLCARYYHGRNSWGSAVGIGVCGGRGETAWGRWKVGLRCCPKDPLQRCPELTWEPAHSYSLSTRQWVLTAWWGEHDVGQTDSSAQRRQFLKRADEPPQCLGRRNHFVGRQRPGWPSTVSLRVQPCAAQIHLLHTCCGRSSFRNLIGLISEEKFNTRKGCNNPWPLALQVVSGCNWHSSSPSPTAHTRLHRSGRQLCSVWTLVYYDLRL